jgi:predicted MFS family arabinose efflux permease
MGEEVVSPETRQRRDRTFQLEMRRAVTAGVLETSAATFLLLIAVQHFQTGATAKALLVMGGPLGLLLSPLAVSLTRKMRWKAATGAAAANWMGCAAFLTAALSGDLWVFVPACMIGVMSLTLGIPMLTQIYQENYPSSERGDLFSKAVMVRVLAAAVFAWAGGLWLDAHMDGYRLLMLAFAAAAAMGAWWIGKCPSTLLHVASSSNPLHGMRHVRSDRLFRWLLASWMLMGFGNLLMLPLRVEFLANPRYGIELSPTMIALVVAMIPSLTNLVFARFWGRLFDRMNFFLLRIVLNAFFVAAITSFFIFGGMAGFVLGGFFFGMATSGGNVAWSLWVTKVAKPEFVADYMGVHSFLTGFRGLLAPLLGFYLIDWIQMSSLAWWSLGAIALASLMLVPEAKTLHRRRATNPVVPRPGGVL